MRSDAFRAAVESKDFSQLEELTSEDVVFRSPVVFKPYEGREALAFVLSAVVEVFGDFRYTAQIEQGDTAVLVFEARVGDRDLQGVDILRFAEGDRVSELTVMVRPLSAANALAAAMKAKLEELGGAAASARA